MASQITLSLNAEQERELKQIAAERHVTVEQIALEGIGMLSQLRADQGDGWKLQQRRGRYIRDLEIT